MVVVMLILALLTHLAVRETGRLQAARLQRQADRQLEEVRDAVWLRNAAGEATGFLADLGRLPRALVATNEAGLVVRTLSELWRRPADVAPFDLRPATAENLAVPAEEKAALADAAVIVPCGWRGPYLRLPFGRDRLLDPWGNPLETPDDAGFARLFVATNEPSARAAHLVGHVRHLGADARPDDQVTPATPADRDHGLDLLPPGGLANRLVVRTQFVNATGPAGLTGEAVCRWYMPCGSAITGAVEKVAVSGLSYATFSFAGLPPGTCQLAVSVGGTNRALTQVEVPPGGREVQLNVLIP